MCLLLQTFCTAVAALLHFFVLSAFGWMLCEGILLYIFFIRVFDGVRGKHWKIFNMIGWGEYLYTVIWHVCNFDAQFPWQVLVTKSVQKGMEIFEKLLCHSNLSKESVSQSVNLLTPSVWYIAHLKTKEPVREQRKNKGQKKKINALKS